MGVEIVTKEDLVEFRIKLIQEIEKLITKAEPKVVNGCEASKFVNY